MNPANEWQRSQSFPQNKRPADNEDLASTDRKRRKRDLEGYNEPKRTKLTVNDYTVGWVCALHIETAAARSMLDEIHGDLPKSPNDSNTYILGSLHHQNVVIACLPMAGYGTNNAAIVASNMRRSFPSIHLFLMVGIGGGVPGKVDIRLGDVVVSTGIIQYDMGKTIQQGHFRPTGITQLPSQEMMTAVSALRARHESEPSKIPTLLAQMQERYPLMVQYADRESLRDLLFNHIYEHPDSLNNCDDCDESQLTRREPRNGSGPMIHYGIIASGNQVIKHAETRNRLAGTCNAICFEMEAAGIVNSLQCLVIRGICDYSDSHKSKEWQKYASAAAAAYATELLSVITVTGVEAPPNKERSHDRWQHLMESLSFDTMDARHSNIKSAYGKTCTWLLSHPDYIKWLTPAELPEHHGFLWIRGKPGAGKSTIMKFLYTRALGNSDHTFSFFFNARGDDLDKSTQGMYRSLLHQLLRKLPDLQEVLDLPICLRQGDKDDGSWDIEILQSLFSAAIARLGQRRVTCYIDALDECGESEVREMVEYFEQLGQSGEDTEGQLYICFSSRHYPTITIQYGQTLTLEDQPGHSQDLEKYVRSKLQAGKGKDVGSIRTELLQKAAGVFMWVILVVNILNEEFRRGRIFAVKKRLKETPAKLSELFKDIMKRDNNNMADLLLGIQWILYAKRPLKPEEFYYAVVAGLDPTSENLAQWDPEQITANDMDTFVCNSSKGLAEVTKSKPRTVQFIHESVRDFLLKDGGISGLWPDLGSNFESSSHDQLKKCCYEYFLANISKFDIDEELPKASSDPGRQMRQEKSKKFPFLEYAIQQVLYHANFAAVIICQHKFLASFRLKDWIYLNNIFAKHGTRRHSLLASPMYILADNNHASLMNRIPLCPDDLSNKTERFASPIFAAIENGCYEATEVLLRLGNRTDHTNRVPAEISLVNDVSIDTKDNVGRTPLGFAAMKGQKKIMQLLIERGAYINTIDKKMLTPLALAAKNGKLAIADLLINSGAELETRDKDGRTPLLSTAYDKHIDIMKLLIKNGADIETKDNNGRTPLVWAAIGAYVNNVRLLIENGADIETKDNDGQTPLSWVVGGAHVNNVRLLIKNGADIETKDNDGRTPLVWAAIGAHVDNIRLLIENGADIETKDNDGRTPLSWAARGAHVDNIRLLIKNGADIETKDNQGWTPLTYAIHEKRLWISSVLIEAGAKVQSTEGMTVLPDTTW